MQFDKGKPWNVQQMLIKLREGDALLAEGLGYAEVCKRISVAEDLYRDWQERINVALVTGKHPLKCSDLTPPRLRDITKEIGTEYDEVFKDIELSCFFLGYPRSGHSLVGAALDAHPNMVIAHELDAFRMVSYGFDRRQIFTMLIENSSLMHRYGRIWREFSYAIPDQWQGRFQKLKVIGDKRGGQTAFQITNNPELLDRGLDLFEVDAKFIHVLRNPYDTISSISRKDTNTLDEAIRLFFRLCKTIADIEKRVGSDKVKTIYLEDYIARPQTELAGLCDYLGLTADQKYLDDCATIVFHSPRKSRSTVNWPNEKIIEVQKRAKAFSFLDRYDDIEQ